jgi:hypothetical protein
VPIVLGVTNGRRAYLLGELLGNCARQPGVVTLALSERGD